jgi:DNA-binding CsgD family transcriptional regulator
LVWARFFLAGWQGSQVAPSDTFASAVTNGLHRGEGRVVGGLKFVMAVWCNGFGRYDEALVNARQACEFDNLCLTGFALVELIEAAVRCGAIDEAAEALGRLEERTLAAGSEWALGMLARSRALLSDGDRADALYRAAIEHLGKTRIVVHLARARLLYGEWLRRANRRVDARTELRTAYEALDRIGAAAYAERARRELVATGETVRKRTGQAPDVLTAQETQVAQLTAAGHTNQEIATQLFISPRTVEYHLHNVFTKLGVSSRRELRRTLTRTPG